MLHTTPGGTLRLATAAPAGANVGLRVLRVDATAARVVRPRFAVLDAAGVYEASVPFGSAGTYVAIFDVDGIDTTAEWVDVSLFEVPYGPPTPRPLLARPGRGVIAVSATGALVCTVRTLDGAVLSTATTSVVGPVTVARCVAPAVPGSYEVVLRSAYGGPGSYGAGAYSGYPTETLPLIAAELREDRIARTVARRGPEDALRSLKKYLGVELGEYDVRFADEEGTFERPFAMIFATTPAANTGPISQPWMMQSFTVHTFPLPGATGALSKLAAIAAQERLDSLFALGRGLGAPYRVPLFDYTGIPDLAPSHARHPSDYLMVETSSLANEVVRDNDDTLLYSVRTDLRCGWGRQRRIPSAATLLGSSIGPSNG